MEFTDIETNVYGDLDHAAITRDSSTDAWFVYDYDATCDITAIVAYYGYRYYSPKLGRWPNRDPIGEEGGLNAYAFAFNYPVAYIDDYGLRVREGTPPCRVVPPSDGWPFSIRQIQRPSILNLPSRSTSGFHGAVAGAPGMLMDWWTFWRSPLPVFDSWGGSGSRLHN